MSNSKKYLVTGATGKTGGHAVQELLKQGASVRALVHKIDERSEKLKAQGVEIVEGDLLDFDSISKALKDISGVYFVYSIQVPGILTATSYLIQAAREEGVESIVNMSQKSARREAKSHAAQDHWVAERILDLSGLKVTHIRPTFFAEWFTYFDTIKKADKIVLPFGEGRYAPIAAEDQGRVIANLLLNPDPHNGKVYPLYGPVEYNLYEDAEIFSEVLGRKISYEAISIETFEQVAPQQGFHPHFVQHIANVAQDCRDGVFAGTNSAVKDITGQEPMGVKEFIERNIQYFK
ncbi:NmrA family NAD(P)-binding protein [Sphingobacterium multivorum]|uniref:NmrA family NAD(P)-binding protein n=1 Tax=Sphingobacterium multivorum TaxID=28454 RepID=UPI00345E3DE9